MVHEGEAGKIFKCEQCKYASAHKQILKSHVLRVHMGKKQTKSHRCPGCSKIYLSAASLHSHKRKKHPMMLRKERMIKMKEKLKVMKKITASPKSPKKKGKVVDDYRYSLTSLTAKAAVQRAKETSFTRAKKEAMLREDDEQAKVEYINEITKDSGKKEEGPRIRTGRKKVSKYKSFVLPKQEKPDSDSDCEFYTLIEKDCGNSMSVGCASERGDVETLFQDESVILMSKPFSDDAPLPGPKVSTKKKSSKTSKKDTASLPDEPLEDFELRISKWITTIHQSIVPDSHACRWGPDKIIKTAAAPKLVKLKPGRRPNAKVVINEGLIQDSELEIIPFKSLEPPKTRRSKRSDPSLDPNPVKKRRIVRREGNMVIYEDDPLAAIAKTQTFSNSRILTIAQRLENAMLQTPPGTEPKRPKKPSDPCRTVYEKGIPIEKMRYNTLGQRIPIPDPPRVPVKPPKKDGVIAYDSLRKLATDFITEAVSEPQEEPLEPMQVLPMRQESIFNVKEEPTDDGYSDAQPSTSSTSGLNISPQFTKVKKRGRKKKTAAVQPLEVVTSPFPDHDVQQIISNVYNSHELTEVTQPEVVEEVEELVEYIEVKPVEQEAEQEVEEPGTQQDLGTLHDLQQFSALPRIKEEPVD